MLSQVCVRVLLVTLGCTVHVTGGILRRSAELEAGRETALRVTIQPCSSSLLTQESGSASEDRPDCACRLPWSGNTWSGNSVKSFDVVHVPCKRNVCREVQVEKEKCTVHWSSRCITNISSCITCHTVVTGKRTECKEVEFVLQELRQTDRRHLKSNLGKISPIPLGQVYYSPDKVIVWQLQAMEGHRVYLELSHIDLHNEDGNCSDYIEIRFNPCTPPTKICDNRVNSYTWSTSQTRVQVRFVSDHSNPTNATGFRGMYRYYPLNTSRGGYSEEEPDDKQHESEMEC